MLEPKLSKAQRLAMAHFTVLASFITDIHWLPTNINWLFTSFAFVPTFEKNINNTSLIFMKYIKEQIGRFGAMLAIFGFASSVLAFFGYNLRLLMWVDLWGNTLGWVIRIGTILVGVLLLFMFGSTDDEEEEETPRTVKN